MIRLLLIFLLGFTCFLNISAEEKLNQVFALPFLGENFLSNSSSLEDDYECMKRPFKNEKEFQQHVHQNHFEPTLSAECEPLATIAGCVNVISGKFFQIETDLKSTTIDPLDFVRYYDSGCLAESFLGFGFGSGFPLWASSLERDQGIIMA